MVNEKINEGIAGFDWSSFESGYNKKIKTESNEKVYSHADYAEKEYQLLSGKKIDMAKDAERTGTVYTITDLKPLNDHEVLATVNYGASDIVIDLNKETKYLSMFADGEGNQMTPEMFIQSIKVEQLKKNFLANQMTVQVAVDKKSTKASIWNGHQQSLIDEMYDQIKNPSRAYVAKVVSNNGGGYFVEVMDTVKAFMPGSMAAMNKITDFEALLDKTLYVMVESYTPRYGFVVSHKKYLNAILPSRLAELKAEWEKTPEKEYEGVVTGTTKYGIFVELDGLFTGMLHKTLLSDDLKMRWKAGEIEYGEPIHFYIHNIEDNRLILSDVDMEHREAVIALREAEDQLEREANKTPEEKARDEEKKAARKAQREDQKRKREEIYNNKLQALQEKFNG